MIRATFTAVPRRLPVLWAKLVVFVAVTAGRDDRDVARRVPRAEALIAHYRTGFSLGDPARCGSCIGTGVYLTLDRASSAHARLDRAQHAGRARQLHRA